MDDQPLPIQQQLFNRTDLRLRVLQALCNQPGYMANQEVLLFVLSEQGHAISRDRLYVELAWLDQIAHALIYRTVGKTHVATLTADGLAVVEGVLIIPGIRRPLPHELPTRPNLGD